MHHWVVTFIKLYQCHPLYSMAFCCSRYVIISCHQDIQTEFTMTSWHETVFRVTDPLWGEPLVTSGFPSQWPVTQNLMFSLICAWQTVKQTFEMSVIWDTIAFIITLLQCYSARDLHGELKLLPFIPPIYGMILDPFHTKGSWARNPNLVKIHVDLTWMTIIGTQMSLWKNVDHSIQN